MTTRAGRLAAAVGAARAAALAAAILLSAAADAQALARQPAPPARQSVPPDRWVSTWTSSLFAAPPHIQANANDAAPIILTGRTLRQIVRASIGGTGARIRLSNEYGDRPLVITSAHIALSRGQAAIDATTDRVITFDGRASVVIRAGASIVSDAVSLAIPSHADLAVSIFIADSARGTTRHLAAHQTNYRSAPGDFAATDFAPDTTTTSWHFLAGLDVVNAAASGVIVAIGNSITDGTGTTTDANTRWPNVLAQRLLASKESPKAVVNAGIGGNRVLTTGHGASALERFDRDVLMQPGVTHVIVLEGVNDITRGTKAADARDEITADELIAGHKQMIVRAHERGVVIFGATLTPIGGMGGLTPERVAKWAALNAWIRTSGAYDGVIDFDRATRDPADSTRMLPAFDSGDHLHPSDAGYKAMGDAIDLTLFRKKPR